MKIYRIVLNVYECDKDGQPFSNPLIEIKGSEQHQIKDALQEGIGCLSEMMIPYLTTGDDLNP